MEPIGRTGPRRQRVIRLCVLMAASACVAGAAFEGRSLEAYLREALEANPRLEAFEHYYEAATERIPQAASLPDPMLQVTRFIESVQTRTGPQDTVFLLSQQIPWFGTLKNREAAASAEAEALWYAYQGEQLTLVRDLSEAFHEYGYTGRALQLTGESLDLLEQLEPIVEERVKGGGKLNALLRLKVETGKLDDRLRRLEKQREVQSIRLSELLALPGHDLLPFPEWRQPGLEDLPSEGLGAALEVQNPELKMLARKIESAEARQELARLARFPDLKFGLNYIDIGSPEVNPATPDAGQDPWGVTVSVTLPLWSGKNKAARAEALAGRNAAEREYDERLLALRAELRTSRSRFADAKRRMELYRDNLLDLARQAVENSRSSYESGRGSILELIDSERSLLELELLDIRAEADAWKALIRLQTLVNGPVGGHSMPVPLN